MTPENNDNPQTSPWLKAGVVLLALAVVGIGYIAYEQSRPTIGDAVREAAETQFGEEAVDAKVDLLFLSTAQDKFFNKHSRYAESIEEIGTLPPISSDLEMLRADSSGWRARAVNRDAGIVCTATDETPRVGERYLADCRRQ